MGSLVSVDQCGALWVSVGGCIWSSMALCGSVWVGVRSLMRLGVGQCGSVWVNADGCIWSNRPRVGQCGWM